MSIASETIGRPQLHPRLRAIIEQKRAELFAEQVWRPGCARCGVQADRLLPADAASAWWADHRDACIVGQAA